MLFDYQGLAARAASLCARFGAPVTVNRYTPTVNATTGAVTKGSPTSVGHPIAVGLGVKYAREPESLVRGKNQKFLIAADGSQTFIPESGDEVVHVSGTWLVQSTEAVAPGATAVIYLVNTVAL